MATGRFLTPLTTTHVSAGRKVLTAALSYEAANGRVFTVPAGFYSDGASVPRVLWALYPPFGGQYEPAAWLHDYLYAYAEREFGTDPHGLMSDGSGYHHVSRAEVDGLFAEAMAALGFRWTGRETIYRGVRLGGWLPWSRYRAEAQARQAQ